MKELCLLAYRLGNCCTFAPKDLTNTKDLSSVYTNANHENVLLVFLVTYNIASHILSISDIIEAKYMMSAHCRCLRYKVIHNSFTLFTSSFKLNILSTACVIQWIMCLCISRTLRVSNLFLSKLG